MENKILFLTHPDFAKHYATYDHPECPDRTEILRNVTGDLRLSTHLELVHPEPAEIDALLPIHPKRYLDKLQKASAGGNYWFGYEDTFINKYSYDVALLSAGGSIEGVSLVLSGKFDRAFCSIRPPGHHASSEQGMGFCLINNIAVATRYAQAKYGVEKILILDWDVHHGNGTQDIFVEDPSVFYLSIHEHPTFIFPGTGRRWETGSGRGKGYTLNIPLPPGAGDSEYMHAMETQVIPAIKSYGPDLILISAGFDAHREDPLSDMNVTEKGFRMITSLALKASEEYSSGKVVSMLEGGYNIDALKESVHAHVEALIFFGKEEKCSYRKE